MKLENIEKVQRLLNELDRLNDVIRYHDDSERNCYFKFKYSNTFDDLGLYYPKLDEMMIDTIKKRIDDIQEELKQL